MFLLGRLIVEDFCEVVHAASDGYGAAATKLLRPMFEGVVTMMWLIRHPEDLADFVDYHYVHVRKTMRHFTDAGGDPGRRHGAAELTEIEKRYKAVRGRYLEVLCKKCNKTRDQGSWTKRDLASMARAVGLGEAYLAAGYMSTLQLHATVQKILPICGVEVSP